jgi:hypothetical protein
MIPPREELRYHGPVVALVGPACASACEFFGYSLTLQDRVRVAGIYPTAGAGGSVEDFLMPLGVSVRFTIGRAVDPGGEIHIEGRGVVPDVPVLLTEENFLALYREGEDIVLEAALEAIGKPRGAGVIPEGPPRIATRTETDDAVAVRTPALDDVAQEAYDQELFQPGTRLFTIQMGQSRDVLWSSGWCASDEQFDQNWDNIELVFTLDGKEVPLTSFSRQESSSAGTECRAYHALLSDWPVGEHVVVTEMRFAAELNDGMQAQVYAAGSRFYEYHVYVTP